MTSRYDASYDGIGQLLRSEMIGNALFTKAQAVRATAEANAPHDPKSDTHFRDAFHVLPPEVDGDRVRVTVYNDDDAAVQIELGTSNTPAHHTLARALDAVND